MISLKAFAPVLATSLGLTPAAMYERQRALVRANVLPTPIGRGRGNGLPATPENVATLLIAVLVTDNLSDTDDRVNALADAEFDPRLEKSCLLTGKPTFKEALAAILAADVLARDVHVSVSRSDLTATIYYCRGRRKYLEASRFGRDYWSLNPPRMEVVANLPSQVMRSIWAALRSPPKVILEADAVFKIKGQRS
jgi:hypothetical protein